MFFDEVSVLAVFGRLARKIPAPYNPWAQVETHRIPVPFNSTGGTFVQAFHNQYRKTGTLIVVTTAIDAVERAINVLAVAAHTPVVYGSVVGKGDIGRVFRVIPGATACYQCILDAQAADPASFPQFGPDENGADPDRAYHQGGIPGLGLDVEIVANFVARMALQTLGKMAPTLGISDAQGDHLLWSNNIRGNHFDHPLQLRWERFPRSAECRVCGQGARPVDNPSDVAYQVAELEKLLGSLR
ncbi:MAG: ThiF family adenylyltransferase [Myxococcales bacterium]|nr:ThiF family adenylyltransferase [Myxococcales bacterium]